MLLFSNCYIILLLYLHTILKIIFTITHLFTVIIYEWNYKICIVKIWRHNLSEWMCKLNQEKKKNNYSNSFPVYYSEIVNGINQSLLLLNIE